METILIVGAGQAGGRAAQTLRAHGFEGAVLLVGDEQHRPYERPALSKTVLTAADDNECFDAWLHSSDFYATRKIDWIADGVERLDVTHRTAMLRSGRSISFDKCLLTTGGRARHLPGTAESRHVFTLRTLPDAMRVRQRMIDASSVAVIGGGFLGLEFAASARARGIDVTVVEAGEQLLGRALPHEFSERLRAKHEQNGVKFMLGARLVGSVEHASGVALTFTDHAPQRFDFVVVAIGQQPNEELAKASGLETGNGIHVDAHCRTSGAAVYAAGDCANFPIARRDSKLLETMVLITEVARHPAELVHTPFERNALQVTFQVIRPLVIRANELSIVAARVATEFGATMGAAVFEHVNGTIFCARDDHRRRTYIRALVVPAVGHFGLQRNEVPGTALKNPLNLASVHIVARVHPIWYRVKAFFRPDQLLDGLILDARRTKPNYRL